MKTSISELSPRQQEIVRLVARGYVDKQIGAELGISEHTVGGVLREVFRETGVQNRAGLICHLFQLVEK